MKGIKIPFDIKYRPQIESGEYKVVTRDGHPVRIICWDRKSAGDGQPIVALVENGHYENSIWVEENGVYKGTIGHEYDLFILTPEPELTEFEEMLYSIFDAYNGLKIDVKAAVDVNAKTLLELAKKEICKGCTVGLDQYWKGRDDERKEQKPLSTEETELNSLAFLSQMGYTCIPPKKEHQNNSDAPKKALGGALNSPLDKDKNLDDIAQDYVEAVKEYNPEPTWNLMQTAVCYGYHYREQKEQKPADRFAEARGKYQVEWSEEDEKIRNSLIASLSRISANTRTDSTSTNYTFPREIAWLKSLCPQPKVEWSKEDENKIKDIIDYLECWNDFDHGSESFEEYRKRMEGNIQFMKSLRPSWKPSEEQMEALERTIRLANFGAEENRRKALESLHDQLKKLM